MNRRQFFRRTVGPLVAAATARVVVDPHATGVRDNAILRYVRAVSGRISRGEFVWTVERARPVGIAMTDIPKGHYGWIQIAGRAKIPRNVQEILDAR